MSKITVERSEMSSLGEMHCHVLEAADYAAPGAGWKERVTAAARVLNLGWERAKGFYYQTARRVDAEEMDNARAAIRALREQRAHQKAADHLAWLEAEIGRFRASGEELHGPHVDGLVHFLRVARGEDGPVAVPPAHPDAD